MAANFIGWVLATFTAEKSPVIMARSEETKPTMAAILILSTASRILFRANSKCLFFRINQALTPTTKQAESV